MAQQTPADLEAALKQAIENYKATWQHVDTELYNLCRRRAIWLTSFVSKHLHFHCSLVPIYDSIAAGAIGRFVDWGTVDKVRAPLMDRPDWSRAYRNYVAAFVVLYEQARAETPLKSNVRDIDYLLWQPAPVESGKAN